MDTVYAQVVGLQLAGVFKLITVFQSVIEDIEYVGLVYVCPV